MEGSGDSFVGTRFNESMADTIWEGIDNKPDVESLLMFQPSKLNYFGGRLIWVEKGALHIGSSSALQPKIYLINCCSLVTKVFFIHNSYVNL